MGFEEDTYSSIFLALKHPVRRRILRILNESPATYTQILNGLGVETGFLNYHLDSLGPLIAKNEDGQYSLSEFGKAALALITRVEVPLESIRRSKQKNVKAFGFKINPITIFAAVLVVLIVVGAVGGYYAGTLGVPEAETITQTQVSTVTQTQTVTETPTVVVGDKIGLVYAILGGGYFSFNDMAFLGADDAAKDFGLTLLLLESVTEADYRPNLRLLAKRGDCVVIIAAGFLLTDALNEVAEEFPDQLFAGIDIYIEDKPNILGIGYDEHKGSAMVGCVAALLAAAYEAPHVGMALGIETPVHWKFEIGYKFGVDWGVKWYEEKFGMPPPGIGATPPKERVLWTYTGPGLQGPPRAHKGYEAAKAQFAQGAVCCYNSGGPIGLGIFQAAEEVGTAEGRTMGPPFGIGVDANQDWIRPGWIIASMMKRVDTGAYLAVKRAVEGTFEGGLIILGPEEGGIAMSTLEDIDTFLRLGIEAGTVHEGERDVIYGKVKAMREAQPDWIWEGAAELEKQILREIVPPAFTAEEIAFWRGVYG